MIYTIQTGDGILKVEISKTLQQDVRTPRACYDEAFKKKHDVSASDERKAKEKKRAADHIKLLKAKKVKLATAVAAEAKAIDDEIAELEKTVLYS